MLQEEAAESAKQLAKPEYAELKASSGWLEKWKNAYGISPCSIEGESDAEPVEKIACVDSDSEEVCVDAEPAQPKITSLFEAIEMLDDLVEFAERRLQDESLVSSLNKVCSAIQNLIIQNFRQKRISDYFGTTA